jgi:endonuclease G, mitochondrial
MKTFRLATLLALLVLPALTFAADYKPIELDPSYLHDKWGTTPVDIRREFRAYTVSFDSADDDDGDEIADVWGIPHWVAYEIKKFEGDLGAAPGRPSPWLTDKPLHESKTAPDDKSYHFANAWRDAHPNSKFLGYDRGHMCMKHHAFRLGANADWNTHTMLNACPQRAKLNQGIWLDLEKKCAKWADMHDSVWIITGPVVYGLKPSQYLGQRELDEVMVAIPDAFFKIVIREVEGADPAVLALIYPQRGRNYKHPGEYDHTPFLTNVRAIEYFTGLTFLTNLDADVQERVKKITATELWSE